MNQKLLLYFLLLPSFFIRSLNAQSESITIPYSWSQNALEIEDSQELSTNKYNVGLYLGNRSRPKNTNDMGTIELSFNTKNLLLNESQAPVFALASTEYSKLSTIDFGDTNHFLITKIEIGTRPAFAQWKSGGIEFSMGAFWVNQFFQDTIRYESYRLGSSGLSMRLKLGQRLIRRLKIGVELNYDQQLQALGGLHLEI